MTEGMASETSDRRRTRRAPPPSNPTSPRAMWLLSGHTPSRSTASFMPAPAAGPPMASSSPATRWCCRATARRARQSRPLRCRPACRRCPGCRRALSRYRRGPLRRGMRRCRELADERTEGADGSSCRARPLAHRGRLPRPASRAHRPARASFGPLSPQFAMPFVPDTRARGVSVARLGGDDLAAAKSSSLPAPVHRIDRRRQHGRGSVAHLNQVELAARRKIERAALRLLSGPQRSVRARLDGAARRSERGDAPSRSCRGMGPLPRERRGLAPASRPGPSIAPAVASADCGATGSGGTIN